jgi:uncharacterized Ntn-hydrolase superfamily protein
MTFSIAARCPETGMVGVGVSTALLCVGQLCPFPRAGVGAISTQSFVNPYLGLRGLDYLGSGLDAAAVRDRLASEDEGRNIRQFSVVDNTGGSAAFTGEDCVPWCGHRLGDGYAVAGNMLTGEDVVTAMAETYEASGDVPFAERLVRVLEAGQAAGGDKRGRQSAALKVMEREDYPLVDIRVDDHPDPVVELRRIWGLYNQGFCDVLRMMPTKANPAGSFDLEALRPFLPK